MSLPFKERIQGCLYGAAIGTELGFRRDTLPWEEPSESDQKTILTSALDVTLPWSPSPEQPPKASWTASLLPLLRTVVRTYLHRQGRITPEDWATELKSDSAIANDPAFWLLGIHSTQELLREGMHPRLSGFGAVPSGLLCAATIPAGIYHAGDPEYAYLDAVEIASVSQRTPGVEWAALTAAAVAAALKPDATADTVIATTLALARAHAPTVYDETARLVEGAQATTREQFPPYFAQMLEDDPRVWRGHNPIGWTLMLLPHFSHETERLLTLALLGRFKSSRACVAGALVGALNGLAGFPNDWREGIAAEVAPLLPLEQVVIARLEAERSIIQEIETVASPTTEVPLFDRVYGCILAGAIGNAMGSPVENLSYAEIDTRYPQGITGILEPGRLESEDDNQMAMLLIETYIRRNGAPASARDFGETWKAKLKRSHFFYCMQNSYDLICAGLDARVAGHWSFVTGSTVMCMEPVGIYHLCDPDNAYLDATSISYMYQRGLDVTAAAILAASVAAAFKPGATVDSILLAALHAAPKSKMLTFDTQPLETPYDFISKCLEVADKYDDVLAARKELYEKCLRYHCIDPLELLGLAYAMFKIARGDVRLSAIGGTNIGRDSDTIAGRAAMLSGALRGAANVPHEWVALFQTSSLEKIRQNATRFTSFLLQKKLPQLQARQQLLQQS